MFCSQEKVCYNKDAEISPAENGFEYLKELTSEEKRELIKMWKERNNVSKQREV